MTDPDPLALARAALAEHDRATPGLTDAERLRLATAAPWAHLRAALEALDAAVRERDEARAERDRYSAALEAANAEARLEFRALADAPTEDSAEEGGS